MHALSPVHNAVLKEVFLEDGVLFVVCMAPLALLIVPGLRVHLRPAVACNSRNAVDGRLGCRVLDLTECRGISVELLQQCLTSLGSLQILELNGNTEVREQNTHPCLTSGLSHGGCRTISSHGVR